MLALSTMTATPSTSKTWSSSLALSKASAYWKPEQPPPRTATRRAWPSASPWPPEQLADLLDGLGAEGDRVCRGLGHFTKCSERSERIPRLESERANRRRLRHHGLPSRRSSSPNAGIQRISLYVSIGDRQEAEAEITDFADFYERLRASEGGATTSQPSIGDFVSVYEPLLEAGREIVSIHISAGISGTFEAAVQARDRLTEEGKGGERIRVFDSRSAAGGMGLCVLAASAAAAAGGDGEAVLARAEQAREELKMWFAIDTLEYLRRGGRIGGARAWIGSALKIKPILTLEEEITPVERVRTRKRSIERLRDYARQHHEDGYDAWVVQHIQDFETADALIEDAPRDLRLRAGLRLRDRRRPRRPRRPRPARHRQRLEVGPGIGRLAAASEGHQAAYGKSDDGGADDQLRAVLADLAPPVGELGDAGAEHVDRVAEVAPLGVDVARGSGPGVRPGRPVVEGRTGSG